MDVALKADTFSSRIVSKLEKLNVPLCVLKHFVSLLDMFDQLPMLLSEDMQIGSKCNKSF